MVEEIKYLVQDEIKFDLDKAIDNKSIMQATAIMEKLKKKIAADKEVISVIIGFRLVRVCNCCC